VNAPAAIILGRLARDTILPADGNAHIDEVGGNLLYAAAAARLWGLNPGLVARISADFPADKLEQLNERGLDLRGINKLPQPLDVRRFVGYSDLYTAHTSQPVKHFARHKLPFPKSLLNYEDEARLADPKRERTMRSLRPEDLPTDYNGSEGAHLCPLDYQSHRLMPAALRAVGVATVTLEAARSYMNPGFWTEVPDLVNGLSVFIVEEVLLRTLFTGRGEDLWQMVEAVASFNCNAIVVRTVARGVWIYDAGKRYHLPAYPERVYDITDSGSSFSGALLAELVRTGDLVRAVIAGSATASLAVEGTGALYVLDTLPDLARSRAQALEAALRRL
jgi:sugar/nucleoside kinase (ribokinase family)